MEYESQEIELTGLAEGLDMRLGVGGVKVENTRKKKKNENTKRFAWEDPDSGFRCAEL